MLGTVEQIGEGCQTPFNAGFLTHLYLIRTDQTVYVHSPLGGSLVQTVTAVGIQTGAIITEFLIKPKTATFSEGSSQNADGIAYNMSLSVPMKGTAADVTAWVFNNAKRRYLIITRDTLGNCYLCGQKDNGARVSWSRQVTGVSTHSLSFSLTSWHPLQFIPTVDMNELFPDREFDYSFDISFS